MKYDYLIVGAGLAGCVLSERLATVLGKHVLLLDRRSHIAGNCFDRNNTDGILVHAYGPHLFHTNNKQIVEYLSKFTEWRTYEYKVLSSVHGTMVPMPINRTTINKLFGLNLQSDESVEAFLLSEREPCREVRNSEDYVVSHVGRRLYELLYRGYTRKQWGLDPSQLSASVCARLPVRTTSDDRYFTDQYQLIPRHGYTAMIQAMLQSPLIEVCLNTDFKTFQAPVYDHLIYTGPIDEYFDYIFGKLPYRSLRFEYTTYQHEWQQPVATVHYPNEHAFTRTTEYKHITGQINPRTTVATEFPSAEGEPYYPIPTQENELIFKKYEGEARKLASVHFVGRMASYRYYNMDQVIAQSLRLFEKIASGKHGE
jgi:UDP-galactopyranose mutase